MKRWAIPFSAGLVVLALGSWLPLLGSQATTVGDGKVKEEVRKIGPFEAVEVGGAIEALVSIGPEPKLTLSGDGNILPLIRAEVGDGVLVVEPVPNARYRMKSKIKATIVAPRLGHLTARGASNLLATLKGDPAPFRAVGDGAGRLSVEGLAAGSVEVKAKGASRVTLKGRTQKLTVDGEGAATITAGEIPAESAEVVLAGSTRAEVHATKSIRGKLSGASRLTVLGNPAASDLKTEGVAKIERR